MHGTFLSCTHVVWPTCACQTLARPLLGQCARALHLPSVVTTNHTQSEYTVSSDINYSGCSRNRLQSYMCFRADVTRYCVGHAYIARILAAMDTRVDMYLISIIASTIGSCISGNSQTGCEGLGKESRILGTLFCLSKGGGAQVGHLHGYESQ
jgi:hypothetical protein